MIINKNRVIFGYGTVEVGSNYHSLTLNSATKQGVIGLTPEGYSKDPEIKLALNSDEVFELIKKVKNENYFEFKGIIFDFMSDNNASKSIVLGALEHIAHSTVRLMAV